MWIFSHSAILYLNDNFDGGELFFTNRDAKTVTVSHSSTCSTASFEDKLNLLFLTSPCPKARVKPSCGRLVGFSSGPVNPHGVTAVNSGRRCALALWFTKEKLYRDMVSTMTTAHSADLLLRSDLSPAVMWSLMLWHMLDNKTSCSVMQIWWLVSCFGIHNAQSVISLL